MSEHPHRLPRAKIQNDALSWFFWALPVGAAVLCAWFLLHDFVFAGPTVTIYFRDGDGLQEQNSTVKYRGVNIGQVESLTLTKDDRFIAVRAKLRRSAANVARQGSVFWVVRPEVKLGAISGLQTIVSGSYVTVQPGSGAPTNVFMGAAQAPITPIPGIQVTLLANSLDSLETQSQIFYRGIPVGEVTDFHLSDNASFVVVHARIQKEYAPLVRMDSQFWNAGGINAHLGLFSGLNISAESAATLVSGGIAFATPDSYGPAATNGAVFFLNSQADPKWANWNPLIPLGLTTNSENVKNPLRR